MDYRQLVVAFLLAILISSGSRSVAAQDIVQIAQVDPSNFPQIVLYVRVTDTAGVPVTRLGKDNFTVHEDRQLASIIDFVGTEENRPVDIVFVFDTTSSMDDEIEGVKDRSIAFANRLQASNRDFRLGLLTFGDEIRGVYATDYSMTEDAEEFKGWISDLFAAGGGDPPEISLDAMAEATNFHYRTDAQKILILITDAPPHEQGTLLSWASGITSNAVTKQLTEHGYTVYAVAYDDVRFREIAGATNGAFYDICAGADFSSIIDEIGATIADQYRIVYQSTRPTYDGTMRNIVVTAGGSAVGGSTYLEEHLVQIRSSAIIGLLLLAPLLALLLIPPLYTGWRTRSSRGQDGAPAPSMADRQPYTGVQPTTPAAVYCGVCGQPLRPGARFCAKCGAAQPVSQVSDKATVGSTLPATCVQCGHTLRAGAKFCSHCGQVQR